MPRILSQIILSHLFYYAHTQRITTGNAKCNGYYIFAALNKPTMFNKRTKIKELLSSEPTGQEVIVMGWVRTFRNNQFIALNDGSTNTNLQIVVPLGQYDESFLKRITTGASLKVSGEVVASVGKGQKLEIKAKQVEILGDSDPEKFPLQPKK
ncbi:MAG TPA: OB-fold nucleic acid binding domain-containing protein, partial [Chitinophagaceae bacterium]|nr:OB-fold nucleic acid binding domain-containing protein [Chitinophagaceae bacterium]